MVHNNTATEMCITKGQEAIVHSWQALTSPSSKKILDALFVELQDPPMPIALDGLPLNIVLLTKTTVVTNCQLPDDTSISVSRNQVEVLPNFAMTDYASQGKTRLYDVVDLTFSWTHQNYYTALSRGVSIAGTLILSSFLPSKIMGGASGALCQEFRELELLDDITTMHFEGKLPWKVAMADHRSSIIALYHKHKGLSYMPSEIHKALKWSKHNLYLESDKSELQWWILDKSKKNAPDKPKLSVVSKKVKRSLSPGQPLQPPTKKAKLCPTPPDSLCQSESIQLLTPIGTQWQNNSCTYNMIISVLFNVWCKNPNSVTQCWQELQSDLLDSLIDGFYSHINISTSSRSY